MTNPASSRKRALLGRGSWGEALRIGAILRKETVGGALLLAGAVVAMSGPTPPGRTRTRRCGTSASGPNRSI